MNSLISLPHLCTDVIVLGIVTLVCTGVMVLGLLFVYFQLWNGLQYHLQKVWQVVLPNFLFNVGLFTLMYMASFTALAILWSSLPIILKFSTDVMWPVLFWCSYIGDGAFRCSLYLSSIVLADSPIYSSHSQSCHIWTSISHSFSSWCCPYLWVILVSFYWFFLLWNIHVFHISCKCSWNFH